MGHRLLPTACLLVLAGAPALTSCAAVLGSKTAEVPALSEPPGAEVYLDGNRLGTTPVTVRLPHKRSATLVFKRPGYRDATCFLQSSTQAGWVILDVLFGLVPIVIDAATGDWNQISNKSCTVTMPPDGGAPMVAGSTSVPAPAAPAPGQVRPAPPASLFQSSAPNEVVSDASRASRRTVVGDMLRLGTITAFEQGPVGITRTAVGEAFHTSSARDLQYPRLALAYSSWTTPGTTLVVELWEHGRKIGEFTDGAFFIGSRYSTPLDCGGPTASGICGYGDRAMPDSPPPAAAPAPPSAPSTSAPAPIPATSSAPVGVPSSVRRSGHRGFHFNLGLGAGAADLTCDGCDFASNTALSGYLALGGAVADNAVLGVESTGWSTNEFDTDARVYSLMATLTGYLSPESGLFLTTGLGLVGYSENFGGDDVIATGFGYSGRLGYELRASGRLTFTPYVGFISTFGATEFEVGGTRLGEFNINNLQAGLAVGVN